MLERASNNLYLENFSGTREILSLAKGYYEKSDKSINFDRWYAISFRLELLSNNLDAALDNALIRLSFISENQNGKLSDANSNLGLIYGLLGDLELASKYTEIADEYIFDLKDEERRYYNLINKFVINRCLGYNIQPLADKIRNWAIQKSNSDLEKRLDYVAITRCMAQR